MAYHHIFYKILIYWTCFITSNPATIDKFKSSIFYHLLDFTLCSLVLHIPPSLKVPYLSMSKPDLRILQHVSCDIGKNPLNTSILSCSVRIVTSIEVLYGSPQPPSILMWVRYNMKGFSFIIRAIFALLLTLIKLWSFFEKTIGSKNLSYRKNSKKWRYFCHLYYCIKYKSYYNLNYCLLKSL